jgi:hypothetical protein
MLDVMKESVWRKPGETADLDQFSTHAIDLDSRHHRASQKTMRTQPEWLHPH